MARRESPAADLGSPELRPDSHFPELRAQTARALSIDEALPYVPPPRPRPAQISVWTSEFPMATCRQQVVHLSQTILVVKKKKTTVRDSGSE